MTATPRRALCAGTVIGPLTLLLAACSPTSRDEPDLAQVVARHSDARGGKRAIENIRTFTADLRITEPGFTVNARYVATREGTMRIDIESEGKRVFTEALGPDGGWQMRGDGAPEALSPEGEEALKRGIIGNLYGLHELRALGFEQTLIGRTDRNGRGLWEIRQTAPDGSSKHIYIDADSHLVSSEIATGALHPDVDSTETRQETFYSDHADVGGVLFPTRMEKIDIDTAEKVQTVVVTALKINEAVDGALFSRPEPAP